MGQLYEQDILQVACHRCDHNWLLDSSFDIVVHILLPMLRDQLDDGLREMVSRRSRMIRDFHANETQLNMRRLLRCM